jgi:hypothetical protein
MTRPNGINRIEVVATLNGNAQTTTAGSPPKAWVPSVKTPRDRWQGHAALYRDEHGEQRLFG